MTTTNHQPPLNPRWAAAVFFSIYSLVVITFLKLTFFAPVLSWLSVLLFALIAGVVLGSLLGKALAKKRPWYRAFFLGIFLACLFLIVGSFCFILRYFFMGLPHWLDYLVLYGTTLLAFTLIIGMWFIPLTGLIAIYFNKKFLPGLIAVDKKRIEASKPHAKQ